MGLAMSTQSVIKTFERYVVPNYRRSPVCLERGDSPRVVQRQTVHLIVRGQSLFGSQSPHYREGLLWG